jgi:pheromone A receptor
MNIYLFYMRDRRFKQLMSSTPNLSRNRYIRLMAISTTEILGTIPLGTLYIVRDAKEGVDHWRGWKYTHDNYSAVYQFPSSVWKNNSNSVFDLEMYRWSLVLCSFIFFALFGFADEARKNYRRVYVSIASRIGYSTFTLLGSSHACVAHSIYGSIPALCLHPFFSFFSTSSVPHVKNNGSVIVSGVKTSGVKQTSSVSRTEKSSISSISESVPSAGGLKNPDFKIEQYSPSNTVTSSSVESLHEFNTRDQSTLLVEGMPTLPPATVPPHLPETTQSTLRPYSGFDAV